MISLQCEHFAIKCITFLQLIGWVIFIKVLQKSSSKNLSFCNFGVCLSGVSQYNIATHNIATLCCNDYFSLHGIVCLSAGLNFAQTLMEDGTVAREESIKLMCGSG